MIFIVCAIHKEVHKEFRKCSPKNLENKYQNLTKFSIFFFFMVSKSCLTEMLNTSERYMKMKQQSHVESISMSM